MRPFPVAPPLRLDTVARLCERRTRDAAVASNEVGLIRGRQPTDQVATERTGRFDLIGCRRGGQFSNTTIDQTPLSLGKKHAFFFVQVLPDLVRQFNRNTFDCTGGIARKARHDRGHGLVLASQHDQRPAIAWNLAMLHQGVEQDLFAPVVTFNEENPQESNEVHPVALCSRVIRPTTGPCMERTRNLINQPMVSSDLVHDLHHDPGAGVTTPAAPGPLGSAAAETRPPDQ